MSDEQDNTHTKLPVRRSTKVKYDGYAEQTKRKLVDIADASIEAFLMLPKEQQDALIERRDAADAENTVRDASQCGN